MTAQHARRSPSPSPTAAQTPLTWEADVPLLRSATVLRQLVAALGLSMLVVFILLVALSAIEGQLTADRLRSFAGITLGLFAGLLFLAVVAILLVYGSRYHYRFTLDERGVRAAVAGATRKRSRLVNLLLVLSGRPTAMGVGILAEGRQEQQVGWRELDAFSPNPRSGEINLHKGQRVVMLLWCPADVYPQALTRLDQHLPRAS